MIKNGGFYPPFFCKEKADGIKPSALTVLTIKLESEYNFSPQSLCIRSAKAFIFTTFKVCILNACYNVFSKSYVSTYFKAFIAISGQITKTICVVCITTREYSRLEISRSRTFAIVSIYAPRTRLRCFCSALR